MPQGSTLAVEGYSELMRALQTADREQKRAVRTVLRHVGDSVQTDARAAVLDQSPVDAKTAGGYRTYVRTRGVGVEQSLRRTTGAHPEWGAWQMRHALIPAALVNEDEAERSMEHALDVVAEHFNRGGL